MPLGRRKRKKIHYRRLPAKSKKGRVEFRITWTQEGRKELLGNRELFDVFRYFRDRGVRPEELPDHVKLPHATIERIAGPGKGVIGRLTSLGVFRVTLKNGKSFAVKAGHLDTDSDGYEIEAAELAKSNGLKAVEHYAQFFVPRSKEYFVVMKNYDLPTGSQYKGRENPGFKRRLANQVRKLNDLGLGDARAYNCFVHRKKTGGYELIWFDLRRFR